MKTKTINTKVTCDKFKTPVANHEDQTYKIHSLTQFLPNDLFVFISVRRLQFDQNHLGVEQPCRVADVDGCFHLVARQNPQLDAFVMREMNSGKLIIAHHINTKLLI